MVDNRGKKCSGVENLSFWPGRDRRKWGQPVSANAALFAGLPYFPFHFDTPEPLTMALFGAAFLMIAWRICRRS